MMAGLSLMLANLTRQQHVNQKKAETGLEMNQLHHRILGVLYDGDACLVTLGKGSALQNERRITKLLNKGGKTVLETGVDINRQVRVKEMVIKNVTGTGRTKEAQMHITIKKLGEANKGTGDILKKFALTVELDTNGKVARCHHTLDSKEHAIHQNICESLGGKMEQRDGPTTECTLTDLFKTFCEGLGGVYTNPTPGSDTTVGKCNQDPFRNVRCVALDLVARGQASVTNCPSSHRKKYYQRRTKMWDGFTGNYIGEYHLGLCCK